MKIGVQINQFKYPGGTAKIGYSVKTIAQAAEAADFDSLWVMDHFFQIPNLGQAEEPMLEAYTTLGYLAGVTEKVKLGAMVTGVIYREPAVLIKAITTLDVLSAGRAYFGIGAGWFDYEANSLGLNDPLNASRFTRLEETLQIAKQMWAGNDKPYNGKIYQLERPLSSPKPVTKPHPPILIGGGGEQKTLRFVAEYGDACNLFADREVLKHKLEVLKKHCKDVGRPYEEIEKTCMEGSFVTEASINPNQLLSSAEELAGLGVDHIILRVSNDAKPESYEKLAPVIKKIKEL